MDHQRRVSSSDTRTPAGRPLTKAPRLRMNDEPTPTPDKLEDLLRILGRGPKTEEQRRMEGGQTRPRGGGEEHAHR